MLLNIMHRAALGPKYGIFREQQRTVHELGIRCTVFVHYKDLFDEQTLRDVLDDHRQFGDEIGLALHDMSGPGMADLAGNLPAIWLFDLARKREILTRILGKFREVFGHHPSAVASYHFDSSSLRLLKEIAPEVTTIVGGCFEEGVRVFHGCNHSWYLFNEGMPWGPWYPSKTHALRPARDEEDAAGVVAVPHLVRDMSLAYEGRNDFWASHPPNIIRGMGNEASFCPYDLNLVDQYRMQADFNGCSYYNTFVSSQWLTWNHNSEYPPEVAWALYTRQLEYFKELKDQGVLEDLTLTEYARWHKANRPYREPDVYLAKEMLYASKKHYYWHIDPDMRVLVDANQGGSIGDLRAYIADIAVATGPDTEHLENASYPYLVQSQYRTGYPNHSFDGSRFTLKLTKGDEEVDLCTCATKVRSVSREKNGSRMELTPAEVLFGDGSRLMVITDFHFQAGGRITVRRRITGDTAGVKAVEYLKGTHGRTEYPEAMHGIRLELTTGDRTETLDYGYRRRALSSAAPSLLGARVPQIQTRVTLVPAKDGSACSGIAREGHIYEPYFVLQLTYDLDTQSDFSTCLTLQKAI